MSDLPEIDPNKVAQRLNAKGAEKEYQLIQLELLAEALRDERDQARTERDDLSRRLAEALNPVQNITSLPTEG